MSEGSRRQSVFIEVVEMSDEEEKVGDPPDSDQVMPEEQRETQRYEKTNGSK